jgi:secreted protein with Ig-like and vWFA domain/anti-sigma factor RsiW
MNHNAEDARLTAYALGELPPHEAQEVEALLASSPEARQEVEEIRGFAELLTQVFVREAAEKSVAEMDVEALVPTRDEPAVDASETEDSRIVPMPERGSRWPLWAGIGVAAAICVLAASWWLPPLTRLTPAKKMARVSESARVVVPAIPEHAAPATVVETLEAAPVDETTTDPVPRDSMPAPVVSAPGSDGLGGPELMRRYGLIPTPNAVVAPLPARSSVPTAPPPAAAQPATHSMSPELMNRYGLVPQSPAEVGRGASPAAGEPAMRSRYGLSSGSSSLPGLVTRSGGASPSSRDRLSSLSDNAGRSTDYFVRREQERMDLLIVEARTIEPASGGANPGYVDAGDNVFLSPLTQPLSTFGLDVDTGSYANVRRFLMAGTFPPRAAVRVEEMINYFPYRHTEPTGDDVFGVRADVAMCPWEPKHRLVRIALKARAVTGERPVANLVFLVDVSGSMQPSERLPLLKEALRALAKRLAPSDRVAIVTYASSAGVHLPSTSAEERDKILEAIDSLASGGSTNGEGGIRQAYEVARRHFIPGGVNRVLLCTDGDFNVGMSDQNALVRLIESEAKSGVFLTTLGVGTDNFKDALMRQLADRGNGSYHFLDTHEEAQRVLLEQRDATFITVARDAKAQVEFNPGNVAAWRLIGYEKRLMPAQDFNDDTKDAGEVGAGQTVTVLYEIVPVGVQVPGSVDPLKYQPAAEEAAPKRVFARTSELLTLKLRYQRPEGSKSVLKEIAVADREREPDGDFKFAAAVAAFGMALRDPNWNGGRGFDTALNLAQQGIGEDPGGWRSEFLTLVRKARGMRR